MLAPILGGQARAVLGVPTEGDKKYLYRLWNIYLTGERVYPRKSLLPHVESLRKAKYGVEIYLSSLFKRKETKIVYLQGLISPNKYEKRSPIEASKEYFREGVEIALGIGKKEILSQEDYRRIINFAKAKTMIELKEKKEEFTILHSNPTETQPEDKGGSFLRIVKIARTRSDLEGSIKIK